MALQFAFDAIGTKWVIDIYKDLTAEQEIFILCKIKDRIDAFDVAYSRFREDSLVTKMSQVEGVYFLGDDARDLMSLYKHVYEITGGQLTPLIGQALVDAGYDATYSLTQKKELSVPPTWDDVLIYEHPLLTIKKPVLLDFGAAGKGYLVDLVGKVLEENGIHSYCIDAGGDILHRNEQPIPLRVGLEHPDDTSKVIGVVEITNKSLCGSAGNRRTWGEYHHILHPETLTSPRHMLATWVIADSTIIADAIATALFFTSPEKIHEHYEFEYLILRDDYSIEKSIGFSGEFF